jgi:hypothetical protein
VTSVLDVWRAVDPEARLVSGDPDSVTRPVRAIVRTRAAPPHLPPLAPGHILVADASIVDVRLDDLARALRDANLDPVAVWVVGHRPAVLERAGGELPVIASTGSAPRIASAAGDYLEHERDRLRAVSLELRLQAAEASLADPQPGAPAGVVAARIARGVAVTAGWRFAALNPRPAGTALATRFASTHARLLDARSGRTGAARRTRDGLWVLEREVDSSAAAWLFDDLPFAAIDVVALEALTITLRALLRRSPDGRSAARAPARLPPSTGDVMRDTLLAVARANGRVAPAARALGVHRNTVLYRLRRAAAELGIDPRRPDHALRLLGGGDDRPDRLS